MAQGIPGDGLPNTLQYHDLPAFIRGTEYSKATKVPLDFAESKDVKMQDLEEDMSGNDQDYEEEECENDENTWISNLPSIAFQFWQTSDREMRLSELAQWNEWKADAATHAPHLYQVQAKYPWWRHQETCYLASFASLGDIQGLYLGQKSMAAPQGWLEPGTAIQGLELYRLGPLSVRSQQIPSVNSNHHQMQQLAWNQHDATGGEVWVMKYQLLSQPMQQGYPTEGYCVYQMDNYHFLYPGSLHDHADNYVHPQRWFWKVTQAKGAVPNKLTFPVDNQPSEQDVYLPFGTLVQVLDRVPSAKYPGNFLLKVIAHLATNSSLGSDAVGSTNATYQTIEGGFYQFNLDTKRPIFQPLPMFVPVQMRLPHGSRISKTLEPPTTDLPPAPPGAHVTVTERAFAYDQRYHRSYQRLRLADCDGWLSFCTETMYCQGDVVARPVGGGFDERFDPRNPGVFFYNVRRNYEHRRLAQENPFLSREENNKHCVVKTCAIKERPRLAPIAECAPSTQQVVDVQSIQVFPSSSPTMSSFTPQKSCNLQTNLRFPLLNSCHPSPLHVAVALGDNLACAREADKAAGKNILNQLDKNGHTALDVAALVGRPVLFEIIQERGGESNLFHDNHQGLREMLNQASRDPEASRLQILWEYNLVSFE